MGKQEATLFIPNSKQVAYLKSFFTSTTGKKTEIAKDCNVARETIWKWKRKPEFVEWFNGEVSKLMEADLPCVWMDVRRRSKRSHPDSELYIKRFDKGFVEKKKIKLEGNVNTQNEVRVSVVNITEDKKEVKE